jgi:hypothetical protein
MARYFLPSVRDPRISPRRLFSAPTYVPYASPEGRSLPVLLLERLLPFLALHRLLDGLHELVALRLADAGAPKMPRQLASSTSTPCSFSDGMPSSAFGEDTARARILPDLMCCSNSERPETPAVTWPPMIAETASPAALERHVVHLRRLDAERLRDHAREDVVGAAGAAAAPRDAAGVGLELVEQLLQVLGRWRERRSPRTPR